MRPAATEPSLRVTTGKAILQFMFVVVSLPLLTLRGAEIGRFSGSLVGVR